VPVDVQYDQPAACQAHAQQHRLSARHPQARPCPGPTALLRLHAGSPTTGRHLADEGAAVQRPAAGAAASSRRHPPDSDSACQVCRRSNKAFEQDGSTQSTGHLPRSRLVGSAGRHGARRTITLTQSDGQLLPCRPGTDLRQQYGSRVAPGRWSRHGSTATSPPAPHARRRRSAAASRRRSCPPPWSEPTGRRRQAVRPEAYRYGTGARIPLITHAQASGAADTTAGNSGRPAYCILSTSKARRGMT